MKLLSPYSYYKDFTRLMTAENALPFLPSATPVRLMALFTLLSFDTVQ